MLCFAGACLVLLCLAGSVPDGVYFILFYFISLISITESRAHPFPFPFCFFLFLLFKCPCPCPPPCPCLCLGRIHGLQMPYLGQRWGGLVGCQGFMSIDRNHCSPRGVHPTLPKVHKKTRTTKEKTIFPSHLTTSMQLLQFEVRLVNQGPGHFLGF
jgi:hypothetical protein